MIRTGREEIGDVVFGATATPVAVGRAAMLELGPSASKGDGAVLAVGGRLGCATTSNEVINVMVLDGA